MESHRTGSPFGVPSHQQQGGGSPSTIPTTTMQGKVDRDGVAPMDTTSVAAAALAAAPTLPTTPASTAPPASRSPSTSPVPTSSATDLRSFPPSMPKYGSKVTLDDEQSSHRPNLNGSLSNLLASPMSCPPHINASTGTWSTPSSTSNTPMTVPTVIHTGIGPNGIVPGSGPTPYFPTMPTGSGMLFSASASASSKLNPSTSSGGGGSGKTVQVAAKKKHQVKASASSTSLHSADGSVSVVSSSGGGNNNNNSSSAGGGNITARRQKRLERNRESARLSRRRRKQYLEILEEKVNSLSLDVDQGRRAHARVAIDRISQLRAQVLRDAVEGNNIVTPQRALDLLDGPLSRTSKELLAVSTFWSQQLKSFALAPHTKAVLWLTLQYDEFYRGGRSSSERLSAARIGERVSPNITS